MPFSRSVSLVLPVFQEEETIAETLAILNGHLSKRDGDYEIIIVNDGSTDSTGQVVENFARNNEHVKLIHNVRNQGSGKSLFIAMKAARFELVATNFADLPFDISELGEVENIFSEGVDFVVVVRKDRSANTFYRKITSLVNFWLIRSLFGVTVSDYQFVQVYKKHIIESIEVESSGTFAAPELIIKALDKGFVFKEYRTDFHARRSGKAKCGSPKIIIQTIIEMLRFWMKRNIGRRYGKAFEES